MPGSLAHTNTIANMLFGSISGSAVAAAAAVGTTMTPMQKKEGYSTEFSASVNISSAPTGMLIPPSNIMIVYSLASGGTSIAALFLAGYIPGILWGTWLYACRLFHCKASQIYFPFITRIKREAVRDSRCDTEPTSHRHRNWRDCWRYFYRNRRICHCRCLFLYSIFYL